jgi:plasmid stabilization system protein ParE
MKYRVKTGTPAQQEIRISYVWGCEKWGVSQAQKWVQELRKAIASLSMFPERYGFAPEQEQEELGHEVRQMIFQRYRVLFTVKETTVHVLHVRGSYTGEGNEEA